MIVSAQALRREPRMPVKKIIAVLPGRAGLRQAARPPRQSRAGGGAHGASLGRRASLERHRLDGASAPRPAP
jgi:hypothetical protein